MREDVLDRDIGDAEGPVENAHHLARQNPFGQRQLLLADGFAAQPFDLAENLVESGAGHLGPDLRGDGQVARPVEVDGRGHHAVGVAVLFAQVAHQTRPEVAAQHGGHDLHPREIGVVAGEEQPADAQRGLQGLGPLDVDERTALGFGETEFGRSSFGELFGQPDDGFQLLVADVAAAYGDGVAARV